MDTSCSGGWGRGASQRPPGALGFIDVAAPGRNRGLTSEGHRVPSPSWLCREPETAGCPWRLRGVFWALPRPAVRGQATQGGRRPKWLR